MVRSRMNWLIVFLLILTGLLIAYIVGPRPKEPDFTKLQLHTCPQDLRVLEDSIIQAEAALSLKPDNAARIVWAKPYERTAYSIVYLHGNGASQEEGDPIHEALAHQYGCNLFLARLADHGLTGEEPLVDIDPVEWMQSALDAIAVGRSIGDSVIVLSCSTGSTLALYLAAKFPGLTAGQIMLSPNIDLYDPRSFLLVSPWGLQLSRITLGGKYYAWPAPGRAKDYWYTRYRIEGLVALKSMLDKTMTHTTFKNISDPVCIAYYYQNHDHQDKIVSIPDMQKMMGQVSTPLEKKHEIVLKDAGTHIIGSDLFNDHLHSLWEPLTQYCEKVLHWVPVDTIGWMPFLDTRS